jgi:hypothetical protein
VSSRAQAPHDWAVDAFIRNEAHGLGCEVLAQGGRREGQRGGYVLGGQARVRGQDDRPSQVVSVPDATL